VRRPLRFLAHKLELSEAQVGELAGILDALKIERAQASVDTRRTTAALAESIEAGTFDAAKATGAAAERQKSVERVQAAVVKALERIHSLLTEEQRKRMSYLLRTGQLSI
jgi:Spy/CpxP family protein refolding chaperone